MMSSAIKTSMKSLFTYSDGAPFGVFFSFPPVFCFLCIFELGEVAVFFFSRLNFLFFRVFYNKVLMMSHVAPLAIRISYVCIRFFSCLVNGEIKPNFVIYRY